jgi:hypothetical protein
MNNIPPKPDEPTAVNDVRIVREAIATQHGGNLREHMAETNRIFEELRAKLDLKVLPVESRPPKRSRIS